MKGKRLSILIGFCSSIRLLYEQVRDTPLYDWGNLVGDVGGYMGMFLGVSLLSAYQWAEGKAERYGLWR